MVSAETQTPGNTLIWDNKEDEQHVEQSPRCKGCDFQIRLNRCGGACCHPRDSRVQLEQRRALAWCGALSVVLRPAGCKSEGMSGRLASPGPAAVGSLLSAQ